MNVDQEYDLRRCGQPDLGRRDGVHDRGLVRASQAHYCPPQVSSDPTRTVFVGRLAKETDERALRVAFEQCGEIQSLVLVRHLITGESLRYAFIEFSHRYQARRAFDMNRVRINGRPALVDWERARLQKGWKPRRVGGGFGGFRNSGQMRFGGREWQPRR